MSNLIQTYTVCSRHAVAIFKEVAVTFFVWCAVFGLSRDVWHKRSIFLPNNVLKQILKTQLWHYYISSWDFSLMFIKTQNLLAITDGTRSIPVNYFLNHPCQKSHCWGWYFRVCAPERGDNPRAFCPLVQEILHSLKLVDYFLVQVNKPWYNYFGIGGFSPTVCVCSYLITSHSCWGITDDFATKPFLLGFAVFSCQVVLAKSIPVHSFILSSDSFICHRASVCLFPQCTLKSRLCQVEDLEMCPDHLNSRFWTKDWSSLYILQWLI